MSCQRLLPHPTVGNFVNKSAASWVIHSEFSDLILRRATINVVDFSDVATRRSTCVFLAPQCAALRCPWMSALTVPMVRVPSSARGPRPF